MLTTLTRDMEREIKTEATKMLKQLFNWDKQKINDQLDYLINDISCCGIQTIKVNDRKITGLIGELAVKNDASEIIEREDRENRKYKCFKSHSLKMLVNDEEFVYIMQDCDVYEPYKCEGYTEYWNEKYTIVARSKREN